MSDVTLSAVRKAFGEVEVIPPLDLTIGAGEFVVFVGPSGCGKSTLLRIIAGLEEVTGGTVAIGGRDVTRAEPSERGVAMVFQSYALYPHMSVRENMAFGLEMAGMPKAERMAAVEKAARTLQLDSLLERKPKALSGGQRQRVAIGRAIVRAPQVFLFDEPLSNLDAELRVQMRLELAKLHRDLRATMIYVTHDQTEAMTLADRIVVLRAGRIEQIGTPAQLYADPDTLFVAGFIGSPRMNFLSAQVTGRDAQGAALVDVPQLGLQGLAVHPRGSGALPDSVTLGLRPEDFGAPDAPGLPVTLTAQVVENLGGAAYLYSGIEREGAIVAQLPTRAVPPPGTPVALTVEGRHCLLFDAAGRRL